MEEVAIDVFVGINIPAPCAAAIEEVAIGVFVGINIPAPCAAAMEEVMLQNLAKTRAKLGCVWLPCVPRAFLQIFITTTLHHRLANVVGDRLASAW